MRFIEHQNQFRPMNILTHTGKAEKGRSQLVVNLLTFNQIQHYLLACPRMMVK